VPKQIKILEIPATSVSDDDGDHICTVPTFEMQC
jgi:hypothetical protein